MKRPKMMHVDRVLHDGSGTVVTGIYLSECDGTLSSTLTRWIITYLHQGLPALKLWPIMTLAGVGFATASVLAMVAKGRHDCPSCLCVRVSSARMARKPSRGFFRSKLARHMANR